MIERHSRNTRNNGLGIVILALVVTACMLVHMWLRAPLVAQAIGSVAYAIAFAMTSIASCVAALILDGEPFAEENTPRPEQLQTAVVVVPTRVPNDQRS